MHLIDYIHARDIVEGAKTRLLHDALHSLDRSRQGRDEFIRADGMLNRVLRRLDDIINLTAWTMIERGERQKIQ